jgi:hypothetical protein
VTGGTQSDQVMLGIVSALAAVSFVMNLKIRLRAACLASRRTPRQDLATEFACMIQDPAADAGVSVG